MKKVLGLLGAHLYLVYIPSVPNKASDLSNFRKGADADAHWGKIEKALEKSFEREIVPLCTCMQAGDKRDNWRQCTDTIFDPNRTGNGIQLPHALWFLVLGDKLTDGKECSSNIGDRFYFDPKKDSEIKLEPSADTNTHEKNTAVDSIFQNSVLAEAIALKWLLKNRQDTLDAISKSGLLSDVLNENTEERE